MSKPKQTTAVQVADSDQLSPHFTVHEMLRSQTASRSDFEEQFSPPPEIIENLRFLCKNLLEKVRVLNDNEPVYISSGYRCERLNAALKGAAKNSQHLTGNAADIDFGTREANRILFEKIRDSNIEFDQLLNEHDYSWVHISMKKDGNRREVRNINK